MTHGAHGPLRGAFTDWVERLRQGFEQNLAQPGPFAIENVGKPAGFLRTIATGSASRHLTSSSGSRRRRAFSARFLGDDVRYLERPGRTSPPFPGIVICASVSRCDKTGFPWSGGLGLKLSGPDHPQ